MDDAEDRMSERVADAAIAQRDRAKRELAAVKARLESVLNDEDAELARLRAELEQAHADAQHWEGKASSLSTAVRNIVNSPKMPREQVQSRLLVALQSYDR